MTLAALMIVYQGVALSQPVRLTPYETKVIELALISLLIGLTIGIIHLRARFKEIVM